MEELDFEMTDFQPQPTTVLALLNTNNEITKITSSIHEKTTKDIDDYIGIDSGFGDKYVHAQNCYFDKPLRDCYSRFNYQYIGNQVIEVIHGEYVVPAPEPTEVEILQAENEELKDELTNTQLAIVEIYELILI